MQFMTSQTPFRKSLKFKFLLLPFPILPPKTLLTNQPTNQPTNQLPNKPTNQPTKQPNNQPTNQPTYQPANKQTDRDENTIIWLSSITGYI